MPLSSESVGIAFARQSIMNILSQFILLLVFVLSGTIVFAQEAGHVETKGDDYWAYPPVGCIEDLMPSSVPDATPLVQAIYEAANEQGLPPTILFAATAQESDFMELGISKDRGNYSCGMTQFNVNEWCDWAMHSNDALRTALHWPQEAINDFHSSSRDNSDFCSDNFMDPKHVIPFVQVEMSHLSGGDPLLLKYSQFSASENERVEKKDAEITRRLNRDRDPNDKLPESHAANKLRFALIKNFAEYCTDYHFSIRTLAYVLRVLFDSLPPELKEVQMYKDNVKPKACKYEVKSKAYPLHIGWLLADAMFNAGSELQQAVAIRWKEAGHQDWNAFNPIELEKILDDILARGYPQMNLATRREVANHVRQVVGRLTLPGEEILPPKNYY